MVILSFIFKTPKQEVQKVNAAHKEKMIFKILGIINDFLFIFNHMFWACHLYVGKWNEEVYEERVCPCNVFDRILWRTDTKTITDSGPRDQKEPLYIGYTTTSAVT